MEAITYCDDCDFPVAVCDCDEDFEPWAYAALDGHLRCPDCNSDLDAEGGPELFHPLPWVGGRLVTEELCHDCGVRLADDPAPSPKECLEDVKRSQRIFGEDSIFAHISIPEGYSL